MKRLALILLTTLIGLSSLSLPALASAPTPDVSAVREDEVIRWATTQLDGYYKTLFALQGQDYYAPDVTIVETGEQIITGCGGGPAVMAAFYCAADEQIVISRDILDRVSSVDDFNPAYVLSHEWAHHVQRLSGTSPQPLPQDGDWNQVYTIENELRADCMAGAWMANLTSRDLLDASDFPGVLMMAGQIGDEGTFGRGRSHGTNTERIRAVFTGYEQGIVGCAAITPLPRDGVV